MTTHDTERKHPVAKHRDGAIEVSIWRSETENGVLYNTERTRSYRDQNDRWQRTHSIAERDLLKAARLDEMAYATIQKLRAQERDKYVSAQQDRGQSQRQRDPARKR